MACILHVPLTHTNDFLYTNYMNSIIYKHIPDRYERNTPPLQVWCLVPAGDTFASSRLYAAIAARCLPVVLGDGIPAAAAFGGLVNYSSFWVRVSDAAFLRAPEKLVPWLREISASEIQRRRRALEASRADVLYDVGDSAAGSHFLEQALKECFPRMAFCGKGKQGALARPARAAAA